MPSSPLNVPSIEANNCGCDYRVAALSMEANNCECGYRIVALRLNTARYAEGEDKLPNLLKTHSVAGLRIAITEQNELMKNPNLEDGPFSKVIRIHQLNVPIAIWTGLERNSAMQRKPIPGPRLVHSLTIVRISNPVALTEWPGIWATIPVQRNTIQFHHQFGGSSNLHREPCRELGIPSWLVYMSAVPLTFFAGGMQVEIPSQICRYADVTFARRAAMLCRTAIHNVDAFGRTAEAGTPKKYTGVWRNMKSFGRGLWGSLICTVAYEVVYRKSTESLRSRSTLLFAEDGMIDTTCDDSVWGIGEVGYHNKWLPGDACHVLGSSFGMIAVGFAVPGEEQLHREHMRKKSTMLRLRDPDTGSPQNDAKHCVPDREGSRLLRDVNTF